MEPIHPSEYPHALSMLPIYPHAIIKKHVWLIIATQLALCIISSICISYLCYKKFYSGGEKSWKRSLDLIGPIKKRLQNLQKEKVIWHSYVEWIEDYCSVYYGLLNYLNATVMDLDKLSKDHDFCMRNWSTTSFDLFQNDLVGGKCGLNHSDVGFASDMSWEALTSDEEAQRMACFARAFASLKLHNSKYGSGDVRRETDLNSNVSSDIISTTEANDDFCKDDLESLRMSDDEGKLAEYLETLFMEKKDVRPEYQTLYPGNQNSKISEITPIESTCKPPDSP